MVNVVETTFHRVVGFREAESELLISARVGDEKSRLEKHF